MDAGKFVKTSVIMSTPDFGKQSKSPSTRPPIVDSPDIIIKKDKIRDPVIEVNENSLINSPPVTPESDSGKIPDLKIAEKIRLNPFLMDEAVNSLVEISKG